MKARVIATFRFEAFHRWPNAPHDVRFLADLHRHEFHVRMEKIVSSFDRETEFITLKKAGQAVREELQAKEGSEIWSCEHWAEAFVNWIGLDACEVWEDGENGARVER